MSHRVAVVVTEDEVRVTTRAGRAAVACLGAQQHVQWGAVTRASVYKRDVLTTDLICVLLETARERLEVHEDMEGWDVFLATLPKQLPGCPDGQAIWRAVTMPPFAKNETVLFRR